MIISTLVLAGAACNADDAEVFSCPNLRQQLADLESEADRIEAGSVRDIERLQELQTQRETIWMDLEAHGCLDDD